MTQLARQFEEDPSVRYGITTMCVGLGMGGTVIWENPHHPDYSGAAPDRRRNRNRHRRSHRMSAADLPELADLFPNETITHSYVQDIELRQLPGGSRAARSP